MSSLSKLSEFSFGFSDALAMSGMAGPAVPRPFQFYSNRDLFNSRVLNTSLRNDINEYKLSEDGDVLLAQSQTRRIFDVYHLTTPNDISTAVLQDDGLPAAIFGRGNPIFLIAFNIEGVNNHFYTIIKDSADDDDFRIYRQSAKITSSLDITTLDMTPLPLNSSPMVRVEDDTRVNYDHRLGMLYSQYEAGGGGGTVLTRIASGTKTRNFIGTDEIAYQNNRLYYIHPQTISSSQLTIYDQNLNVINNRSIGFSAFGITSDDTNTDRLYIGERLSGNRIRIRRYVISTNSFDSFSLDITSGSRSGSSIYDLASNNGMLYIRSGSDSNRIFEYNTTSGRSIRTITISHTPGGFDIYNDEIYSSFGNTIRVHDLNGTLLRTLTNPENVNVGDIAIDRINNNVAFTSGSTLLYLYSLPVTSTRQIGYQFLDFNSNTGTSYSAGTSRQVENTSSSSTLGNTLPAIRTGSDFFLYSPVGETDVNQVPFTVEGSGVSRTLSIGSPETTVDLTSVSPLLNNFRSPEIQFINSDNNVLIKEATPTSTELYQLNLGADRRDVENWAENTNHSGTVFRTTASGFASPSVALQVYAPPSGIYSSFASAFCRVVVQGATSSAVAIEESTDDERTIIIRSGVINDDMAWEVGTKTITPNAAQETMFLEAISPIAGVDEVLYATPRDMTTWNTYTDTRKQQLANELRDLLPSFLIAGADAEFNPDMSNARATVVARNHNSNGLLEHVQIQTELEESFIEHIPHDTLLHIQSGVTKLNRRQILDDARNVADGWHLSPIRGTDRGQVTATFTGATVSSLSRFSDFSPANARMADILIYRSDEANPFAIDTPVRTLINTTENSNDYSFTNGTLFRYQDVYTINASGNVASVVTTDLQPVTGNYGESYGSSYD